MERPGTSSSVKVATWHGREGRERREKEREERKVFPATTQASKDTPKEGEGFPAMTKASRDTQGGRKVKRGKKERERERKGEERTGKGRCSQLRRIVQGHTKEREG